MDFTPVEKMDRAEKVARDFFREEWVEKPSITVLLVGLEVEVVLMETKEAVGEAEGTLVEAMGTIDGIPVGEGEDLTIVVEINKVNVVTTQLAMVW